MPMTVAELRSILSSYPDDALVVVDNQTDPKSVEFIRSSGSCSVLDPDQMSITSRAVVLTSQEDAEGWQPKITKVALCQ